MSRTRWLLAAPFAVLAAAPPAAAQQVATVAGRVTDASGRPVAAAQVRVEALNAGALSGADGSYRLVIPAARLGAGQSLTITVSRQGHAPVTRSVSVEPGAQLTQNFQMGASAVEVEGIVVTALGIEREQKSLSTSVQAVSGEALSQSPSTNLVTALSGQAAGVQVTTAGPQGGSARIVIRGANSIAGSNQPLFVVDGVPIDNSSDRNMGVGGADYGNAASDINPSDIESVSVLKGPNAAALYGSRAANGAVVITTRSGRRSRGLGVTISQQLTSEQATRLPSYQNQFGQGFAGRFAYVDGAGGGLNDGADESWGPVLDGRLIPQFDSPVVDGVRQATPWIAHPDNVSGFFRTGRTSNTSVALATSTDRANVRMALTRLDQSGMNPGFGLERTTAAMNGAISLNSRLSAAGTLQYVATTGENRTGTGYDDANPMMGFVWFGRQVDTRSLRSYRNADGSMNSWNYNYHPNPYWAALAATNDDGRDRIIGSASLTYQLTDWLKVMGRSGTDWYREHRYWQQPAGTFGLFLGRQGEQVGANGGYEDEDRFRQERNSDFLVTADRYFGESLSVTANLGGNRRTNEFRNDYTWVRSLVVPGVYNVENSAERPFVQEALFQKEVNSVYASANLGYRDFLFLDVTGRNDWSSTLPVGNNSYFYPSVGGSFVFSDVLSLPGVTSGKVRASWARVGSDAEPYQLASIFASSPAFLGQPLFSVGNTIANARLRPEATTSWEVGTELELLDGRLSVDAAYYDKTTTDQILAIQVTPTSGYGSQVVNAGRVDNHGYELALTAVPIRKAGGFEWEMQANFGRNFNQVVELSGDVQTVILGRYWSLNVEARRGEAYGAFFGNGYLRDAQGRMVVDEDGLPQRDPVRRVLGNYNPDWVGSLRNSFRYRGLDLSFLLDTRQGGDLFSVTQMFGRYTGVLAETAAGRCVHGAPTGGLPTCAPGTGIVVAGVHEDGSANTTVTSAEDYWHALYGIHEAHIYDASYIKLREATLTFALPGSLSQRLGMSGMTLGLTGRNLALWTDMPNIDPETGFDASNVQGLEFGQLPTPRSIGFSVTVTP